MAFTSTRVIPLILKKRYYETHTYLLDRFSVYLTMAFTSDYSEMVFVNLGSLQQTPYELK